MGNKNPSNDVSRRTILKRAAVGGSTALGVTATATGTMAHSRDTNVHGSPNVSETTDRTITIRTETNATYEFSVTGLLEVKAAPTEAIDQGTASTTISNEVHTFEFSGEFISFTVEGEAEIFVDGERFDFEAFPRNTLEIFPSEEISYDISASGGIEVSSESVYRSNSRRVTGTTRKKQVVSYEGELTYLDIDGDASFRKNGDRLHNVGDVLPSTLPSELRISSTSGSNEYAITVTDHAEIQQGVANPQVHNGAIKGRAVKRETIARYSGRVDAIEHSDGGTVTIDPRNRRLVCQAPDDRQVEITPRSEDGFIYDGAFSEELTVTVAPGTTERIKYFGDVIGIKIDELDVTILPEIHEEALDAQTLQAAARLERNRQYQQLVEAAENHGRVRRDVNGMFAASLRGRSDEPDRDFCSFALTDLERGSDGTLFFSQTHTGTLYEARNHFRWMDENDVIQKLEIDSLQVSESVSTQVASIETEVHEFDLQGRPASRQVSTQIAHSNIPDPRDWLDDLWDGITDIAGEIAGLAADELESAIDSAVDHAEDIIIESGEILVDTLGTLQSLAIEFIERSNHKYDKWVKALWRIQHVGTTSFSLLLDGEIFEALGNGNYGCAGCIGAVKFVEMLLCHGVGKVGCAAVGAFTAATGGVACHIFFEAVCAYASLALPDARSICSSSTTPTQADLC